ncbi:hypothetical protein, partial [Rhodoplanes serenus]|uniref:hypothetical protein n=1 Tax=Rhodoplanes serenus TaxID=200615 RepID=UPI001AECDE3E
PASSTERSAAPDSFSAADFLRGRFSQLVFFGAAVVFGPAVVDAAVIGAPIVGALVLDADVLGADVPGAARRSSRRRRGGGSAPSSVDFHSCLPSSRAPVGG